MFLLERHRRRVRTLAGPQPPSRVKFDFVADSARLQGAAAPMAGERVERLGSSMALFRFLDHRVIHITKQLRVDFQRKPRP